MGVVFLGSYLCISILEFKSLNSTHSAINDILFMYFYIRI